MWFNSQQQRFKLNIPDFANEAQRTWVLEYVFCGSRGLDEVLQNNTDDHQSLDWQVSTLKNLTAVVAADIIHYTTQYMSSPAHTHTRAWKCQCGVKWLLSCYQSWLRGQCFPATLTSWPLDPISIKFLMNLWFIYSLPSLACHSTHLDKKASPFYFIFGPDANKAVAQGLKRREERKEKEGKERMKTSRKWLWGGWVYLLHTKGG